MVSELWILLVLAWSSAVLALLPLLMLLLNLPCYRRPPAVAAPAGLRLAVLIPARDEAGNIGAAVRSVLATPGEQVQVFVLDDHSSDGTAEIVRELAAADARVSLLHGQPLPDGWSGKMYACHQLLMAAKRSYGGAGADVYILMDADVRLAPGAPWQLAMAVTMGAPGLVSGVPRQETGTGPMAWLNSVLVHNILTVLLGYLPLWLQGRRRDENLAGGCGQLMVMAAAAAAQVAAQTDAATVYAAVRGSVHDGLALPRLFRRHGYRTALCDVSAVAVCRMYPDGASAWRGFRKNAHAGMATVRALPVWSVLLLGGHVLPWLLLPLSLWQPVLLVPAGLGVLAALVLRIVLVIRFQQPWWLVPGHAFSVFIIWLLQLDSLQRQLRGRVDRWKGRAVR